MRRIGVPVVLLIALLSFAGAAQAAQRFASPGGSGEACSSAAPCSLETAVEEAKFEDEVIVGSGTYPISSVVVSPLDIDTLEGKHLYIHGELTGAMPKIDGSDLPPFEATAFSLNSGDTLAYLEISATGDEAQGIACFGAEIERVVVSVKGTSALGIEATPGCTIRDSLIRAEGSETVGTQVAGFSGNGTALLRNLTVRATGPASVGVSAAYPGDTEHEGSATADLANVIASGDQFDLEAVNGFEGSGKIIVSHSNFDTAKGAGPATITNAGGNQTAPPLFVDAAAGDFREAAGSPTIDAGSNNQIGFTDLAGNTRSLGSAPDIGAYEFVPAAAGGGTSGQSPQPTQPAPPARVQSLFISPGTFRAANFGGAVISRAGKHRVKAPVGATVNFSLSAAATVAFSAQKRVSGRKVGKKCVATTRSNRGNAKCTFFKPVKGGFKRDGAAGPNGFKFSGRLGGRALGPGRYRLLASSGGATKAAAFKIVR